MPINNKENPKPFTIVFTQRVVFTDRHGTILKVYEVGDTCEATGGEQYFVTAMGGIYHHEATKVETEIK